MQTRTIGLAICILTLAVSATAQNTFPSTGNVGIGTTSPLATLDVRGTIQNVTNQNGTLPTISSSISSSGGTLIGWNGLSTTPGETDFINIFRNSGNSYSGGFGFFNMLNTTTVNTTPLMYINASGYVGLGTISPIRALDVSGPTSSEIVIEDQASATNYKKWDFVTDNSSGTDGDFYIRQLNDAGTGGIDDFYINGANGAVGIGTTLPAYTLDVNGTIHASTAVYYPDGSKQTTAWTGTVCGGDYAESVDVAGQRRKYGPGDVLVIDPHAPGKFLESADPYSTSVAGIYSTKPGLIGRREGAPKNPDAVPMAMVGIVPTKVSAENGAIHPGDLLVTSSTLGYAMKGTDRSKMLGAVIGKALGDLDSGKGTIEVVVMLQ